ncbi:PAS domain S-box protein [Hymenobacter sp. YC55]|uniref:PAS domain-containing sensor histidine kinase n=1 Tax=Hymenobacter sp. YC55 TaxID=3034019 RepID=UPI0023F9B0D3|nr:PAS domain S-box protein [Hymenobacter sp. YC55]MDF7815925.1 PAS domain S-box protein [Hymenobacter sp. YC55]
MPAPLASHPPLPPAVPEPALYQVFEQSPAAMCLLRGPQHALAYYNPAYQALFPGRDMRGQLLAQVQPEAVASGFVALLDQVYQSGEPYEGVEMPLAIDPRDGRPAQLQYFNFTYNAFREEGRITGVTVFAYVVTEQVLSRRAAEQQRQLLYQLYQEAPVPIAVLAGPTWVYQLVNPAYQRVFPGRALLGRPLLEALPEVADSPMPAILAEVYRTGHAYSSQDMPLNLARHDGAAPEIIYGTFTCQARRNDQGEVDGLVFFATDVTEQVRMRQQVQQSETRFRRLAETSPLVVWEADAAGNTTYLSPNWDQFGYTGTDLGTGWLQAVHPDDQSPMLQAWHAAVRSGQPFAAELRLRVAATGAYRWHLDRAVPVRDEAGQVVQWVGAAIDIHELKHLQHTLLESEQYFRSMADHVPAMLWVTNPAGACTYLNRPWYELTGQTEAEALGYGWLQAVHPEDAAATAAAFRAANDRQEPFRVVYRLRNTAGDYRWAIDAATPRFDAAGTYAGLVGVVLDVHEQQVAEQALQQLTAQLQATNQQLVRSNVDLDNFVYAASHDLKQPVHNLDGLLDELLRSVQGMNPAEEQLLLPLIRQALQQLNGTIDELAALGQAQQTGTGPVETVALAEITAEVLRTLAPQVQVARARISTDFAARPAVSFPRANLRTVLFNLLSNALKFADPDRPARIYLAVQVADEQPVLVVQDNGLGFDAQKYGQEMFHLFRRLHGHTPGSGVGLYLVNRIVQAHGGRIEVESQEGQGATFRVWLGRV